jgi:hypothetical protein
VTRPVRAGVAVLAGAGLLLGGCAHQAAYARIDEADKVFYGFTDTLNPDGGYTIRVLLPPWTEDPRTAFDFWERRAAELCGEADYRKHVHTARRQMIHNPGYTPVAGDYVLEGYAYCNAPAAAAAAS